MTKRKLNPKPRGRQSAFTGVKCEFLDSYKDEWIRLHDHKGLYTSMAKSFLLRFGYDLALEENPPDNNFLPTIEFDPGLSVEERIDEAKRRDDIYKILRRKISCWCRHRYDNKHTGEAYINKIINKIARVAVPRPRKITAVDEYTHMYWESKLKAQFDRIWASVKDGLKAAERIKMMNEFRSESWDKESAEVRDEVIKITEAKNEKALSEYKQKATFSTTPEGFAEAWSTAETVLPTFADSLSQWLGASVFIFTVSPSSKSEGDAIVMQSAQSETSRGMTKSLLPEFDPDRFSEMHKMFLKYGEAYFTPEEILMRRCAALEESDEKENNMDDSSAASGLAQPDVTSSDGELPSSELPIMTSSEPPALHPTEVPSPVQSLQVREDDETLQLQNVETVSVAVRPSENLAPVKLGDIPPPDRDAPINTQPTTELLLDVLGPNDTTYNFSDINWSVLSYVPHQLSDNSSLAHGSSNADPNYNDSENAHWMNPGWFDQMMAEQQTMGWQPAMMGQQTMGWQPATMGQQTMMGQLMVPSIMGVPGTTLSMSQSSMSVPQGLMGVTDLSRAQDSHGCPTSTSTPDTSLPLLPSTQNSGPAPSLSPTTSSPDVLDPGSAAINKEAPSPMLLSMVSQATQLIPTPEQPLTSPASPPTAIALPQDKENQTSPASPPNAIALPQDKDNQNAVKKSGRGRKRKLDAIVNGEHEDTPTAKKPTRGKKNAATDAAEGDATAIKKPAPRGRKKTSANTIPTASDPGDAGQTTRSGRAVKAPKPRSD